MSCLKKNYFVFSRFSANLIQIKKRPTSIKRTLPFCKLKIVYKSSTKIANQFRLKDLLSKELCPDIVYGFKYIAKVLFVMAKQNAIFTSGPPNIGEFHN